MRSIKGVCVIAVLLFSMSAFAQETAVQMKTVAIGDVDAGYNMGGQKAYEVKETIQLLLKKDLEKYGKGRFNVKIVSPAVVTEGAKPAEAPTPPTMTPGKVPTQAEMAKYMAQMQQWQNQMSGKVRVHKPVAADYFVELKVQSKESGMDTYGAASNLSRMGFDTSFADVSTKSTKLHLVCTMRDPATGTLVDRYTAKASSVKFRNLGGFTSYDYGDDSMTKERLFKSAVNKCAKWINSIAK